MYTLRDMIDPNNPGGGRYNDYHALFMLAYDIEPSTDQFQRFMNSTESEQLTMISLVKHAVDDNVSLMLECLAAGVPEWMMAGAPDAQTHERWWMNGLLNGQTGI